MKRKTKLILLLFIILLITFIFLGIWKYTNGTPVIRVDYIAKMNELADPNLPPEDNAWPQYKNAIKLYVDLDEYAWDNIRSWEYTNNDYVNKANIQTLLKQYIDNNEASWQEVKQASYKSYAYKPYQGNYKTEFLKDTLYTAGYHILLRCIGQGIWRARLNFDKGNITTSMEDCLTVLRCSQHFRKKGLSLGGQLCGVALTVGSVKEINAILYHHNFTPEELKNYQTQLTQFRQNDFPRIDFESERLSFLDAVQRTYTEGGFGSGHVIPRCAKEMAFITNTKQNISVITDMVNIIRIAKRNELLAKGKEFYDHIHQSSQLKPYERRNDYFGHYISEPKQNMKYLILSLSLPAWNTASNSAFMSSTYHQAVISVLALKRWRLENGSYPERLEELKEQGYMDKLPEDAYSDGILRYRRNGDDFILYSWGEDFDDDGGRFNPDDPMGGDDGDWVIWPVR